MIERLHHPAKPCAECPWRTDVEPGRFPAERFATLAASAYDRSLTLFQCHKTDEKPLVCAGFLARGAAHNLAIRLAHVSSLIAPIEEPDVPLFESYKAMAIANGVAPDDPALRHCRTPGETPRGDRP